MGTVECEQLLFTHSLNTFKNRDTLNMLVSLHVVHNRPFATMGHPKNITITFPEMKRSNLGILQSFSILFYIFRGIFKSLNLIEFVWLEGKPCPPATFSHTNALNISAI